MNDLREGAIKAFDKVLPSMQKEPNAHKRACFREGWDAAIAALPDMVPDLAWEMCCTTLPNGCYYTITESPSGKTWRVDFVSRQRSDCLGYSKSEKAAKAAANAHHRAQIMAALGVKL